MTAFMQTGQSTARLSQLTRPRPLARIEAPMFNTTRTPIVAAASSSARLGRSCRREPPLASFVLTHSDGSDGGRPMLDPIDAFRVAITAALGYAPDTIEPGRLHRFSTNGKRSDAAGWCHLFADLRAGVFGDFRAGLSEVWTATPRERMTPSERAALRRYMAEAKGHRERVQRDAWRRNADRIRYLWRQCLPIMEGDPVHSYLCRRLAVQRCVVPDCIRLHPAMPYVHEGESLGTWPAMVAPLVASDGRPLALHRTYLDANGNKADVLGAVKKLTPAAGVLAGGSIRLHEPRHGVIGVAEGIETALAASLASGLPLHAAYCAGALAGYLWPAGVQRLVIFADADPAGREAADKLKERALRAWLRCNVMTPTTDGADWCDVWAAREAVLIETEDAACTP